MILDVTRSLTKMNYINQYENMIKHVGIEWKMGKKNTLIKKSDILVILFSKNNPKDKTYNPKFSLHM